jgi:hypothetical protein
MDKIKCRIHAEELKNVLSHDNSPQRRAQVMRVMDATREHKEIWEDVFSDDPVILEEMNGNLRKVSKPRMLID